MRLCVMGTQFQGSAAAVASRTPGGPDGAAAEAAVTALCEAHALGLVRLAYVMLGDREPRWAASPSSTPTPPGW